MSTHPDGHIASAAIPLALLTAIPHGFVVASIAQHMGMAPQVGGAAALIVAIITYAVGRALYPAALVHLSVRLDRGR